MSAFHDSKILSERDKSLDAVINNAVDESKVQKSSINGKASDYKDFE